MGIDTFCISSKSGNKDSEALLKYDVNLIIHGHTHRPNIHKSEFNGQEYKRIVLGDWYNNSFILKYQKDKILIEKTSFS